MYNSYYDDIDTLKDNQKEIKIQRIKGKYLK